MPQAIRGSRSASPSRAARASRRTMRKAAALTACRLAPC